MSLVSPIYMETCFCIREFERVIGSISYPTIVGTFIYRSSTITYYFKIWIFETVLSFISFIHHLQLIFYETKILIIYMYMR